MPDFKKDTRGFKMKGWSPFTKVTGRMNVGLSGGAPSYMGIEKQFGGTKKNTKEQKEKYAELEKSGIQKRIDRKKKAIERKEAKGSTWGLARKKRKIAKLEEAKKKADGTLTEQRLKSAEIEREQMRRRVDMAKRTKNRNFQSFSNSPYAKYEMDAVVEKPRGSVDNVIKTDDGKRPRKIYDKDVYTETQGMSDHVFTTGAQTKDKRGRRITYKNGYKIIEKAKPGAGWRETRRVEISDKKRDRQVDRKMKRYT